MGQIGNAVGGALGSMGGQPQNPMGGGNFVQTGQFGSQPIDMGGYGGQGFGGGYGGGYGGYGGQGFGGGYGGQMQNPFMGGMGGFGGYGGGYGPEPQDMTRRGQPQAQDLRSMQNPYGDINQMQQQQAQQALQQAQQAQQARQLPAFLQDQEFQGYRQQSEDLSKQMNEYMQKAPMYQQLQDLQGKMRGVQGRYASDPYAGSMGPGALPPPSRQQYDKMMALSNFKSGQAPTFEEWSQQQRQQTKMPGGLAGLLGGFGQTLQGQPQERPQVFPRQGDWDAERQVLRSGIPV
jgi:hypothetical protein